MVAELSIIKGKMKNKIVLVLTVFLFYSFALQAQVQVSKEPFHKNVLENKYIRLLNVWLKPGDTSLFHIHSTPSVFLVFTTANTVAQTKGGEWENVQYVKGHSWYRSFFQDTLIHRVAMSDTVSLHITDVEILSSYDTNTKRASLQFPLLYENEKVFAYTLTQNSFTSSIIKNRGPMVAGLVAGNGIYINSVTGKKKKIKSGYFLYIEPASSFYFSFKGKEKLNMVLFEIK